MPKPYQVIKDYYPSPMFEGQMNTAIQGIGGTTALNNLPGMKIMSAKPANFQQLFDAFVTFIRNPVNRLTWNGSGRGGSGYGMLEGDTLSGECAMFATAFSVLAWAPKPYGLGLPKAEISLVSYGGRDSKGFVSSHPSAGIMGLRPNVAGQELYVWENHKVVGYQGRLWDVMYNRTYNMKDEMAQYQIVPNEVNLTTDDVPVEHRGTYHPAEPALRVAVVASGSGEVKEAKGEPKGVRGVWFKENPLNSYAGPSFSMPF